MRWDLSFFVYVLLVFLVVAAAAAAAVGTAGAAVPSSVLPFVPCSQSCGSKWRGNFVEILDTLTRIAKRGVHEMMSN